MATKFENPFGPEYYRDHFGPMETDGFTEWATQPGLTVLELTFGELTAVMVGALLFFVLSSASVPAAIVLALPMAALAVVHRALRRRYGRRFLSAFIWRRGIVPPDGWYPFDPVPEGELRKIDLRAAGRS